MTGRRVHERYDCDLPVLIAPQGVEGAAAEPVPTRTQNVSLGGMYLLSELQVPYGTAVKVTFRLPSLKEDTVCEGIVRWNKPDGFGVQFGSLRAIEVWGFHQLFKTLTPTPPLP
ncbi:MAG: PilZ domain-containing protein [Sandaracinaceae bacterium]|nr:PilZ domain-containing protein [Sandaracinaceae bacterium]MBP7685306.1 PilZ domain-containing protein [Deltaproteobacteria bacterium]